MEATERHTKQRKKTAWANRIVGSGEEAPEQLLANPENWRVHPKEQQDALGAVLDEVGWVAEVIVNQVTGHVVDGHLRVSLAISRGEKAVPVKYVKLSPDEERLVLATYDPLSALAVMDGEALGNLLREVRPFVVDDALSSLLSDLAAQSEVAVVPLDGIDPDEDEKAPTPGLSRAEGDRLDELGRGVTELPDDALRELVQRWQVESGQTWLIRSGHTPGVVHRLVIGDATDPGVRDAALATPNNEAVIVTSPPYGLGMAYEGQFEGKMSPEALAERDRKGTGRGAGAGGRQTLENEQEWTNLIGNFALAWEKRVGAVCVNLAEMTVASETGYGRHAYGQMERIFKQAGWGFVATRIWHKGPVWGNNAYWLNSYKPVPEYEYIGLFADLRRFPVKRVSERVPKEEDWRFRSVWEFASVASQGEGKHPASFPTELPRRCVLLLTDAGGTVVDPFVGSGTTLVTCEMLGRHGIGIERDVTYAAMTLERLSRLGLTPEKQSG